MLGKIIKFIRVRGRIIPVRKKGKLTTAKATNRDGSKNFLFTLKNKKNKKVGILQASARSKGTNVDINNVEVKDIFKGQGFGTSISKQAAQVLRNNGFRTMTGNVVSPRQLKIRSKFRNTKFEGSIGGLTLERTDLKGAIELLKSPRDFSVRTTSDLPRFTTTQKRLAAALGGSSVVGGSTAGAINAKRKK